VRIEDKLRIVAEAERRGACFAEVARRHEVSRSVACSGRGANKLDQAPWCRGPGAGLHAGADPARAAKDGIGIIIKLAQSSGTERGCALL
jgi:hypothetical protein